MDADSFLKFTAPNSDDSSVQYVLDHRLVNNTLEYLIRYQNPNVKYDVWEKARNLTCYHKLIDYWLGKTPKEIKPNMQPDEKTVEKENIETGEQNKVFEIIGVVKNDRGAMMYQVRIPGTVGVSLKSHQELLGKYAAEMVEYLETHFDE